MDYGLEEFRSYPENGRLEELNVKEKELKIEGKKRGREEASRKRVWK